MSHLIQGDSLLDPKYQHKEQKQIFLWQKSYAHEQQNTFKYTEKFQMKNLCT